jgi:hypothetical protein
MVRGTWVAVALLAFVAPAGGAEPEDAVDFRSAFEREGLRFALEGRARRVTLASGPGELACYAVRVDGRFLHPERADGGRLVGCRFGALDVRVAILGSEGAPLGWVLETGSICGNTHSRRVVLVTVPRGADGGAGADYVETVFDCKRAPVCRPTSAGLEVWAEVQDWGRGGTATSILVPFVWLVPPDGRPRRVPLPEDWTSWHPELAAPHFLSAFVAGKQEGCAALMRAAVHRLHDPANEGWYAAFGLPADARRLAEAADAVERLAAARADLERLLDASR